MAEKIRLTKTGITAPMYCELAAVDYWVNERGWVIDPSDQTPPPPGSQPVTHDELDAFGLTDLADVTTTGAAVGQVLTVGGVSPLEFVTQPAGALVATPALFPGLDPTGATDSSAAVQAAVDAAADGARLVFPAGTYRIDSGVSVVDKNLTIDAQGATFTKSTGQSIISCSASNDTIYPVSTLAAVSVTEENAGPMQRITLASDPGWVRGDVVKVFADDVIPGAVPGDGTTEYRSGQHFTVYANAAGVVDLIGTLHDPLVTNIRATRMRNHRVEIRGGRFIKAGTGTALAFVRLVNPIVRDTSVSTSAGQGVSFIGCAGYVADGLTVENAPNVPTSSLFGYGILDSASSWGRVRGLRCHRARHAFTNDNVAIAAGSAATENYGRPFGTVVTGCIAIGTDNTAFDTHAGSQGVTFADCVAIDCYNAFGLRGRGHSVRDGKAIDCWSMLNIFSHGGTNADSWGHVVDGLHGTRINGTRVLSVDLNNVSNAKETRKSVIRNVTVDDYAGHLFQITNGTVECSAVLARAAATVTDDSAALYLTNAAAVATDVRVDHLGNTAGTGVRFAHLIGAATLELHGGRWDFTSGNTRMYRIVVRAGGATGVVKVDGLLMANAAVLPYDSPLVAGSHVDWSAAFDMSTLVIATGANIESVDKLAEIANTREPMITLRLTETTAPRTLGNLPAGKLRGQMLTMWCPETSTQAITIPHSTTAKIQNKSAAAVVLNAGGTALYVWNGTYWRQVA